MLVCDVCGAKDEPGPPGVRSKVARLDLTVALLSTQRHEPVGHNRPLEEKKTPLDLCARCQTDVENTAREEVTTAVEGIKTWMVEQAKRFADQPNDKDVAADETLPS